MKTTNTIECVSDRNISMPLTKNSWESTPQNVEVSGWWRAALRHSGPYERVTLSYLGV